MLVLWAAIIDSNLQGGYLGITCRIIVSLRGSHGQRRESAVALHSEDFKRRAPSNNVRDGARVWYAANISVGPQWPESQYPEGHWEGAARQPALCPPYLGLVAVVSPPQSAPPVSRPPRQMDIGVMEHRSDPDPRPLPGRAYSSRQQPRHSAYTVTVCNCS